MASSDESGGWGGRMNKLEEKGEELGEVPSQTSVFQSDPVWSDFIFSFTDLRSVLIIIIIIIVTHTDGYKSDNTK